MKAKSSKVKMEFRDFGTGPAVLFIHDDPAGRNLPEDLLQPLAEAGYRVVLVRLRGLDEKSAVLFDPAPHTRDTVALLNYLGIGRAVVFGIGVGGRVLLDLMENHPRRVVASSLVVGPATAKDLRRLAKRGEVKAALREGRLDEFKEALLAALPADRSERPSLSTLSPLRAWVGRVRSRKQQGALDGLEASGLLAGMDLPPVLTAEDAAAPPAPAASRSLASRGWGKIKGLNSHLLALLTFLLPGEDGEEEEILTDLR